MKITEIQQQEKLKILKGLEKAYIRLLEYKKYKNSELVIMKDHKIVRVRPK